MRKLAVVFALVFLTLTAHAGTVVLVVHAPAARAAGYDTADDPDERLQLITVDRARAALWRDDVTKPVELRAASWLALGGLPLQTVLARSDADRQLEHEIASREPHAGAFVQRLHPRDVKP